MERGLEPQELHGRPADTGAAGGGLVLIFDRRRSARLFAQHVNEAFGASQHDYSQRRSVIAAWAVRGQVGPRVAFLVTGAGRELTSAPESDCCKGSSFQR